MLAALSVAPVPWEEYLSNCLRTSVKFEDLVRRRGVNIDAPALHRAKEERLRAVLARGIPLRPGAAAVWSALRHAGAQIALASTAHRASINAIIEYCGLPDEPDAIVSREDIGERPKPDPTCYRLAIERLGTNPRSSVAFEDAPPGVLAAKAAGMPCVALATPTFAHKELQAADAVIDSFEEIDIDIESNQIVIHLG